MPKGKGFQGKLPPNPDKLEISPQRIGPVWFCLAWYFTQTISVTIPPGQSDRWPKAPVFPKGVPTPEYP